MTEKSADRKRPWDPNDRIRRKEKKWIEKREI